MGSNTCDGDVYIHNLSAFIKSHERQLANALIAYKKNSSKTTNTNNNSSNKSQAQLVNNKPVRLSLSLHHLYFLLGKFQEIGINVGPMSIRLDNLDDTDTSINYVSFLSDFHRGKSIPSDAQSVHSMSSVKSVMSSVSALWTTLSSNNNRGTENIRADLKYLYSAFTKLPCLRLAPDAKAKLIEGHEEYPFETSTPINVFKNLFVLEISELDPKEIYGWHIVAEQVRFLVIKKSNIFDPAEILVDLLQEDYSRQIAQHDDETESILPPTLSSPPSKRGSFPSPTLTTQPLYENKYHHLSTSYSSSQSYHSTHYLSASLPDSNSSTTLSTRYSNHLQPHLATSPSNAVEEDIHMKLKSTSPVAHSNRQRHLHYPNSYYYGYQPTSSASSTRRSKRSDSMTSSVTTNLSSTLDMSHLTPSYSSKSISTAQSIHDEEVPPINENAWKGLKHLSFTENRIENISFNSFDRLKSLSSLDLSYNRISEIPAALSKLPNLKSLNLSHNNLTSTKGFTGTLTKLTILNLKGNHLVSLDSLESLSALEKIDIRQNALKKITDLKPLFLLNERKVFLTTLYVMGNAVTSNRGYRIDLFNLFNGVDPDNNIKIDGSRPGLFESRLLLDTKSAQMKLHKFLDESIMSKMAESVSSMNLANLVSTATTTTAPASKPSKLSHSFVPESIPEDYQAPPSICDTQNTEQQLLPALSLTEANRQESKVETVNSSTGSAAPSTPLESQIPVEKSTPISSISIKEVSSDTVLQTNNNILNTPKINDPNKISITSLAPPNRPFSQISKGANNSSVLSSFLDQVSPPRLSYSSEINKSPKAMTPQQMATNVETPQSSTSGSGGYFQGLGLDLTNVSRVSDENTSPSASTFVNNRNSVNAPPTTTSSPSTVSQRRASHENNPVNRISIASPALPVITAATTTITTTMSPTAPSTPISSKRSMEGFDYLGSNPVNKTKIQLSSKLSHSSLNAFPKNSSFIPGAEQLISSDGSGMLDPVVLHMLGKTNQPQQTNNNMMDLDSNINYNSSAVFISDRGDESSQKSMINSGGDFDTHPHLSRSSSTFKVTV